MKPFYLVAALLAPAVVAQPRLEGSARPFIDPGAELRAMNMIPVCHPRVQIESDGRRLKCGRMPSRT